MIRHTIAAFSRPWNLLPVVILALASTACSLFSSPATCGLEHRFDKTAGVERYTTGWMPVTGSATGGRVELRFDATRRPGENDFTLYVTASHRAYVWLGIKKDVSGSLLLTPDQQTPMSLTAMRVDHDVIASGCSGSKKCGGDILVEQVSWLIDADTFKTLSTATKVMVELSGSSGGYTGLFAPQGQECLTELRQKLDPQQTPAAQPVPQPEEQSPKKKRPSRKSKHPFKSSTGKSNIYP